MTKEQALKLIREYAELADASGETDPAITEIVNRWPLDGSTEKAMRWLGFMQGYLYAMEFFSLEELKEHSREAATEGEPEDANKRSHN